MLNKISIALLATASVVSLCMPVSYTHLTLPTKTLV